MTLPEGKEKCRQNLEKSSPEGTPAKKKKLDLKSIDSECYGIVVGLLDLSDDVLLLICNYLKPTDLMALSQCCTRLEELVCDRTLWLNVDFRPKSLNEFELQKYLKFFLPSTRSIATCGFKDDEEENIPTNTIMTDDDICCDDTPVRFVTPEFTSLTQSFIENLSKTTPNLKEFIAENHYINGSELLLEYFPSTLEYLSFKNSDVYGVPRCKSYFSGFDKILPNIECLNLSHCLWFTTHSFLALSKSKTLKKLILYGCPQINDCTPYLSLGFRFGFKALTVLDLRQTLIGDRDLGCFNSTATLRELYLEAPKDFEGESKVTDMGIGMFGNVTDLLQVQPNIVVLLMIGHNESNTPSPLRKLVVRDYNQVTDTSLKHAAVCLPNLEYIDITGTGCTEEGVSMFKMKRPDVHILSNFETVSK